MNKLARQLGSSDVFSVAAGAMISSGLFVLPGIAYAEAGPAVVLAYLIASLLIVPSALSNAELSTAMPRAGGAYFFVERSLGSVLGLFTGFANWLALTLKSAFAIVGMAILAEVVLGALFGLSVGVWLSRAIAVGFCLFFTGINIVGAKHAGRLETLFVVVLLAILAIFIVAGTPAIKSGRFSGFGDTGFLRIASTAGLVFISFAGLTQVASIAEEVKNPGRNIPIGMILAWFVVALIYVAVTAVTVGVVDGEVLSDSLTPVATAAGEFLGTAGLVLLNLAAFAAFVTTANAGVLAASRSPLAMSRDRLLPTFLARISQAYKTPHTSIALTGAFMIAAIVFLDIESLVKTASTLGIILFILINVSVIIMRESRIQSYRPRFKSPLYPYAHIAAILAYALLLVDMGAVPLLITAAFFGSSAAWYLLYVSRRVSRASAVMHIVERVTDRQLRTVTLEDELRDILLERDEITEDRFDTLVRNCETIDIEEKTSSEDAFRRVSQILAPRLDTGEDELFEKFLQRESEGTTVVQPGLAIPHVIVEGENQFDVMLVRAKEGIMFPDTAEPVRIMFVLAGSKDQRNYHLRALMAIAQITQEKLFEQRWLEARDTQAIRNLILLSTRKRDTH